MAETKHTISTKLHIDASLRLAASSPAQSGPGDVTGFAMTPCGGSEADADGDGVGADGFLIVLRHAEEGASQPSLLRFLRLTHTPGLFSHIVGLFCSIVGLFCPIVGHITSLPSLLRFLRLTHTPGVLVCI